MKSTPPGIICFDLDGTLVDTMQLYADVAAELLSARYGVARDLARQKYLETSGLPFVKQINLIVGDDAQNLETVRMFEKQKLEATRHVRLEDSVRTALEELVRNGHTLAISSNNLQENVTEFVRRENLHGVMKRALGWGIEGRSHVLLRFLGLKAKHLGKGDFHFSDLERVLGVPRNQMVLVGDSLHDADVARQHGVSFIGKLGTFGREEFAAKFPDVQLISHISELDTALHVNRT